MKYQLVALFDEESYPKLQEIQKSVCRKYRLYKNAHALYIPISILSNPDLNKLDEIVSKVLKPYKQFKVKINNSIGLNDHNKQVSLKVDEKGYLVTITRNINETLNSYGIKTITKDFNFLNLYMPIANSNYNIKKACNRSNIPFKKDLLTEDFLKFAKINRLELWKLSGNKRDMLVKSFPLREY